MLELNKVDLTLASPAAPPIRIETLLTTRNLSSTPHKLFSPFTPRTPLPSQPTSYAAMIASELAIPVCTVEALLLLRSKINERPNLPLYQSTRNLSDSEFILQIQDSLPHNPPAPEQTTNNPTEPQTSNQSNGVCILTATCHACGSQFRLHRTTVATFHTPPTYCVFCASPSLTLDQLSTEETAYDVLAANYAVPVALIKLIYHRWTTTNNPHTTFAAYIRAFAQQALANPLT